MTFSKSWILVISVIIIFSLPIMMTHLSINIYKNGEIAIKNNYAYSSYPTRAAVTLTDFNFVAAGG